MIKLEGTVGAEILTMWFFHTCTDGAVGSREGVVRFYFMAFIEPFLNVLF